MLRYSSSVLQDAKRRIERVRKKEAICLVRKDGKPVENARVRMKMTKSAFLFGAVFLAVCYTAARTILYPDILPVGVITSLFGGPFFIWLLTRTERHAG